MKRLVSLLAIALVSSLFAAGCGKLKNCADATTPDVCNDDSKFENKSCKWEPKQGAKADSKEGTCKDWAANDDAKRLCEAAADPSACDLATPNATAADPTAVCKWAKHGTDKVMCKAVKLVAKK